MFYVFFIRPKGADWIVQEFTSIEDATDYVSYIRNAHPGVKVTVAEHVIGYE